MTTQSEHRGAMAPPARGAGMAAPDGPATLAALPDMLAAADSATIRIAGDAPETVVRPALAILFRIAVGPSADRYVRRFLAYERNGSAGVGWHWASFLVPPMWAFYRRLWLPGLCFALLPLAGALAFALVEPRLAHADATWIACAVLAMWLLPSAIPALFADRLLYRNVRRAVRHAEHAARSPSGAAQALSERPATSLLAAAILGGSATLLALGGLLPPLATSYAAHDVRERLAETLAAVRGLEADIVSTWSTARLLPQQTHHPAVAAKAQEAALADVEVNPLTGRVRLALGPALRQLWGKTILLFPSQDADDDEVRWVCVPIDIPARYLPAECLN